MRPYSSFPSTTGSRKLEKFVSDSPLVGECSSHIEAGSQSKEIPAVEKKIKANIVFIKQRGLYLYPTKTLQNMRLRYSYLNKRNNDVE